MVIGHWHVIKRINRAREQADGRDPTQPGASQAVNGSRHIGAKRLGPNSQQVFSPGVSGDNAPWDRTDGTLTVAAGPTPEELSGWVTDLAGRLGTTAPRLAIGDVPAWSLGAVLSLEPAAGPGGRGFPPLPVLTVDPGRLASLPAQVARASLAHPMAQIALGQPRRRKNRTTLAAILVAVLAIVAVVALSWPLTAWAGAVVLAVAAAVLVDLLTVRSFLYEADRRVTDALGMATAAAFLDYLRAHPPQVTGWAAVAARALPSPTRRARKLTVGQRDAG
jgi:hypothetical protein